MILENKDCLEFLKELDTESVELVLTEPPYFLGFDGMYLPLYAMTFFINKQYRSIYKWL